MRPAGSVPTLILVESVRCLECGAVYGKPADDGTVQENPGCPECGYVGWLSVALPLSRRRARRRSGADRPRHRRG